MNYLQTHMMFGNSAFGVAGMNMMYDPRFQGIFAGLIIVAVIWTLIWKGLALWHSARNHQTVWFVILLIVNTLGILEIIYLLFFRKNKNSLVTTTTVTHTTVASTPTASTVPGSVVE